MGWIKITIKIAERGRSTLSTGWKNPGELVESYSSYLIYIYIV